MTEQKKDCYSEGERGFMEWGQRLRAMAFEPIIKLLVRLRIKPNSITAVSLFCGLAACLVMPVTQAGALILLLTHVFLDGLDGSLARHLGQDSAKGSFTDTAVDQIVITATTMMLIYLGYVNVIAGVIYIFAYTVVVGFAMIRNSLNIAYSWLIRPRFVIYLWLLVEFYIWAGSINYVIWICNILLAAKVVTGFVKIRREL